AGRFAPGNKFSRGNPFGRAQAELRKALLDAATADDVRRGGAKLAELASAGDVAAARVVLEDAVGKPTPAPNPDTLDLEEWMLYFRAPQEHELEDVMTDRLPPADAAVLAREVRDSVLRIFLDKTFGEDTPARKLFAKELAAAAAARGEP